MSKARSRARRMAMQGLYEWQVAQNSPLDVYNTYLAEHDLSKVDEEYFKVLMLGVPAKQKELDAAISVHLSRSLDEIDPIELSILRVACFEFISRQDVPYKVVINESIELAKTFGAEAGHKFVNGILDKLAMDLRSAEINKKR